MEQNTKKLKIATVGMGSAGFNLIKKIEQEVESKDLDLHYIRLSDGKKLDSNTSCKTMTLYRYKPCTLEEVKSKFLESELSTKGFEFFVSLLEEGDQLYFRNNTSSGCIVRGDTPVAIKRNGNFVHTIKFDYTNLNKKRQQDAQRQIEMEKSKKMSTRIKKVLQCIPKILFRKVVYLFNK